MYIFGCNEVGPAKYLAEIACALSKKIICVANDKSGPIFRMKGLKVVNKFDHFKNVELVITGTSAGFTKSIDKRLIFWAKDKQIPSISVVEHWSWSHERFYLSNKLFLPNHIIVNDVLALEDAVKTGIPESIIKPLGNPYLEMLSNINLNRKNYYQLRSKYSLPNKKRLIFFISEDLKSSIELGDIDDYGYNEFIVLDSIIECLAIDDYLVIKLHPEEKKCKYNKLKSKQVCVLDKCSVFDIGVLADKVIGMSSILLLELAFFRNDVISFRPNAKSKFIGNQLGASISVNQKDKLINVLNSNKKTKEKIGKRFDGSKERIIQFLLETAK